MILIGRKREKGRLEMSSKIEKKQHVDLKETDQKKYVSWKEMGVSTMFTKINKRPEIMEK